VQAAYDLWRATPEHDMLGDRTRSDYRNKAKVFLVTFGDVPVAALSRKILKNWWRQLYRERGHAMANGILAVARAILTHARNEEWIAINPAFDLQITSTEPRLVLWLPYEIEAVLTAADEMGFPFVGDAVAIAVHSGQRLGDVLAMPPRIFETRIRLKQFKRGALIDIPMTRQLEERIGLVRARWAATDVVARATMVTGNEGAEFRGQGQSRFSSYFRRVRARAAQLVAEGRFGPKATNRSPDELAGELLAKHFQDLRDTAVTRLALAGATMTEISSVTGHAIASATAIIRHYMVMQPEMADTAIAKLQAWLDKEGIAV
jgi:hypothetical protein